MEHTDIVRKLKKRKEVKLQQIVDASDQPIKVYEVLNNPKPLYGFTKKMIHPFPLKYLGIDLRVRNLSESRDNKSYIVEFEELRRVFKIQPTGDKIISVVSEADPHLVLSLKAIQRTDQLESPNSLYLPVLTNTKTGQEVAIVNKEKYKQAQQNMSLTDESNKDKLKDKIFTTDVKSLDSTRFF